MIVDPFPFLSSTLAIDRTVSTMAEITNFLVDLGSVCLRSPRSKDRTLVHVAIAFLNYSYTSLVYHEPSTLNSLGWSKRDSWYVNLNKEQPTKILEQPYLVSPSILVVAVASLVLIVNLAISSVGLQGLVVMVLYQG